MAKAGTKATLLNIVSRNASDMVDVLQALQPLLETGTSEADSRFDVQAGQIIGRLRTLQHYAKRCFDELPEVE